MNDMVANNETRISGNGMKKLFVVIGIIAVLGVGIFVFDAPLISSIIALMIFMVNS